MKKLMVILCIAVLLAATACTQPTMSPTPSADPAANAECVCMYGNAAFHYMKLGGSSVENITIPVAVKDCNGRYLVVVWFAEMAFHDSALDTVYIYLKNESSFDPETFAKPWIYSVLAVDHPGAVLLYVTEEELALLEEWDEPTTVVSYVDVLKTEEYQKHGTLSGIQAWTLDEDYEPIALPR